MCNNARYRIYGAKQSPFFMCAALSPFSYRDRSSTLKSKKNTDYRARIPLVLTPEIGRRARIVLISMEVITMANPWNNFWKRSSSGDVGRIP